MERYYLPTHLCSIYLFIHQNIGFFYTLLENKNYSSFHQNWQWFSIMCKILYVYKESLWENQLNSKITEWKERLFVEIYIYIHIIDF